MLLQRNDPVIRSRAKIYYQGQHSLTAWGEGNQKQHFTLFIWAHYIKRVYITYAGDIYIYIDAVQNLADGIWPFYACPLWAF